MYAGMSIFIEPSGPEISTVLPCPLELTPPRPRLAAAPPAVFARGRMLNWTS